MASKITQVVILSAGLGTRLRPITDNIPKVMVPLAGKPLLQWHIEQFKKCGVREFFINLHYLPDKIEDYFGDGSKFGVKIAYSFEPEIRGTAGALDALRNKLGDTFFLIYGDMFSLVDYSKMAKDFSKKPADALGMMIVGRNDHPEASDFAELDKNMKFFRIYPKPHTKDELQSYESEAGGHKWRTLDAVYIFRKKVLDYVPSGRYYELDHGVLPDAVLKGEKFYGYETGDYLQDIGRIESLRKVEEYLKKSSS